MATKPVTDGSTKGYQTTEFYLTATVVTAGLGAFGAGTSDTMRLGGLIVAGAVAVGYAAVRALIKKK